MEKIQTNSIPKKKPAGVCRILQQFVYEGTHVFIRQWYDSFEFVLSFQDHIYSDYVQISDFRKPHDKNRDAVVMNMISILSSKAVATVDALRKEQKVAETITK